MSTWLAATQPGMSFYAELPDNFNLIVNTSQEAVARVLADAEKALDEKISPLRAAVSADNERLTAIRAEVKDNKPTPEQEAEEKKLLDSVENSRKEQESIISAYASGVPSVKQMIDLALLGNGLLQGRELSEFINRSVKML